MPDIVSSATSSSLPSIAEEAGAPQELTPEREAEIREWRDELGAGKSFVNVGPYCALHDALGEIDKLRARIAELEAALADHTEPDVDGAGRTYESYHPKAVAPDEDPGRCLKVHVFSPRDGWRMICGSCDHGKDAACHRAETGGAR